MLASLVLPDEKEVGVQLPGLESRSCWDVRTLGTKVGSNGLTGTQPGILTEKTQDDGHARYDSCCEYTIFG